MDASDEVSDAQLRHYAESHDAYGCMARELLRRRASDAIREAADRISENVVELCRSAKIAFPMVADMRSIYHECTCGSVDAKRPVGYLDAHAIQRYCDAASLSLPEGWARTEPPSLFECLDGPYLSQIRSFAKKATPETKP